MHGLLCDISAYLLSNVGCLIDGRVDVGVDALNFDHAATKESQDSTHFSILLEFAHMSVRRKRSTHSYCLSLTMIKQVSVCYSNLALC